MGFTANAGLPFQPVSRGRTRFPRSEKRRGEKKSFWWNRRMARCLAGTGWCVWAGATHSRAKSGAKSQASGFHRRLSRQPTSVGGWARGAGHRSSRGEKVVPERPEDGRQLLPKSEAPPRGRSPGRPAWARPPVHVASVRPAGAPSPGLRSAGRSGPETRSLEEAAMKGPRPRSSRDTVAANETEKGCRFGPNPSVAAGDAEDTEDRPEGVTPGPQLG